MHLQTISIVAYLAGIASALVARQSTGPVDTCNNRGLEWAKYPNTRSDGSPNYIQDPNYSGFDPTIVKNRSPTYQGTTAFVGGVSSNRNSLIYGSNEQSQSDLYILNHRGFLYTPETGTYIINLGSDIDDIACLWVNQNTMTGWTRNNAAKCQIIRSGVPSNFSVNLPAGRYYPIRIVYGQSTGPAVFNPTITSPSGRVLIDSSSSSGYVVTRDCGGRTPNWRPFGNEA